MNKTKKFITALFATTILTATNVHAQSSSAGLDEIDPNSCKQSSSVGSAAAASSLFVPIDCSQPGSAGPPISAGPASSAGPPIFAGPRKLGKPRKPGEPRKPGGSGGFAPDMLSIGLGLGRLTLTDIPTNDKINVTRALYGDIILGWYLNEAAKAHTYFQVGAFRVDGDVKSVSNITGSFATAGNYTDWGGFVGLGIIMPLFANSAASSAVASSSAPIGSSGHIDRPVTLSAAASVGFSKHKFDAFSGGFSRKDSGPFLRLETHLNIPIAGDWDLAPGFVYHRRNGGLVDYDSFRAVLSVKKPF